MKSQEEIKGQFFLIIFIAIVVIAFLAGCQEDKRKCLKSHIEHSCACVCINNAGVPIANEYKYCDLYEENSTDER